MLTLSRVLNSDPGWYRGDFHLHTNESDGRYTPPELARLAVEYGLDFFAITDHNKLGALDKFGDTPGMLIIPGVEITLVEGHWNVFGFEGWQDWMEEICTGEICVPLRGKFATTTDLLRQIASQGQLSSINHPLLKPWEWRDGETSLQHVHFLEIINDPWWPDNRVANLQAIAFWTACLNAGYRITAIGGSDFHYLPKDSERNPGELPGLPATYVFARALSGAAILEGLQARRAYVSLGPQLCFQALTRAGQFEIGADLGVPGTDLELIASVAPGREASVSRPDLARIVRNGAVVAETGVDSGRAVLCYRPAIEPDCPAWYRLEVLDADGQVLAITNPIFAGPAIQKQPATFMDFARLIE